MEDKIYILFNTKHSIPKFLNVDKDMGKLLNRIIKIAVNSGDTLSMCLDEKEMQEIDKKISSNMCWGYVTSNQFRLTYVIGEYKI